MMVGEATGEQPLRVRVPVLLGGVRLDRALSMLTGMSRTAAASLVRSGGVTVDGEPVLVRARPLAAGELLELVPLTGPDPGVEPEPDVPVHVVHHDLHVVVVDKQAGLVVHPGAGNRTGTLVAGLLACFPDLAGLSTSGTCEPDRPGIVHRLDKGTSGLLVVARTDEAYSSLVGQLARRSVERRYLALVRGHPAEDRGEVEAPIGRSTRRPTRMAVTPGGRRARTRYRVLSRLADPDTSLLELTLDTGRTHQIRVHLAAIGHPVLGDDRYGRAATPVDGLPPGRLFLHASVLGFDHPSSGTRVRWTSPLPAELARLAGHPAGDGVGGGPPDPR